LSDSTATRNAFLKAAVDCGALRFGSYTLKSGRQSPYFFNAGAFNSGASLDALARAYAGQFIAAATPEAMLFGPAYKGIPLVAAVSVSAYRDHRRSISYAFNRKEAKDHGEGGDLVGAPLQGAVWIVDDVISAGTSVRESVKIIRAHGATPAGVLIALDRQERGQGELSAAQEVSQQFELPVRAVAGLGDLLAFVANDPVLSQHAQALADYRQRYGVSGD